MRELLIGGQKSGKSAQAERLAHRWLAASPTHCVILIATALGLDDEMRERIARHQADRARRFGEQIHRVVTVEEPLHLAQCLAAHGGENTLIVIDCLTLWLTHCLMPAESTVKTDADLAREYAAQETALLSALGAATGRVIVVSNEIGLGVIPMGEQVRRFVDALGVLNQRVAQVCDTVTLMTAGLPLQLKGAA